MQLNKFELLSRSQCYCDATHTNRNVTSAGWQVTLRDPIWHVSSRSGAVLVAQTAIRFLTLPYLILPALTRFYHQSSNAHFKGTMRAP